MSPPNSDFRRSQVDAAEELVLLASGLSSAEKSYLKRHLNDRNESELFKLIAFLSKDISEKALFKRLHSYGNGGVGKTSRKITMQIVEILQPFHHKIDQENEMLKKLLELRFLAKKKLYILCVKRLKKLKARAYEYELFEIALRLIKLEQEITFFSPKEIESQTVLLEEAKTVEKFIRNETRARTVAESVGNILYTTGLSAREIVESDLIPYKRKLESLLKKEELSLSARTNITNGLSNIALVEKDYSKAYEVFPSLIKAFEENGSLKKIRLKEFVQIVVNCINRQVSASKCNEPEDLEMLSQVIERTKSQYVLSDDDEQYLTATFSHAMYSIHLGNWQREKALQMAKKMERCVIPLERNKALKAIFLSEFALAHFYTGDYNACKDYINQFLNTELKSAFPDLYLFARILFLFVLSEEKDTLGFFSHYDAVRKAVDKAPHEVFYEKALMKMLLHFNKATDQKAERKILQQCLSDVKKYEAQGNEPFMFFKIEHWVQEKLGLQQVG